MKLRVFVSSPLHEWPEFVPVGNTDDFDIEPGMKLTLERPLHLESTGLFGRVKRKVLGWETIRIEVVE